MENKPKVTIIGSGIGGLICGIELAKNNYNVTILEKNNFPGGYCTSFKKQGYTFDLGPHFITAVGDKNNPIGRYLDQLPFKTKFSKLTEFDNFFIKNLKINNNLPADKFICSLQKKYPPEKKAISKFFEDIKNILFYYNNSQLPNINSITYKKMLDNYFKSTQLKTLLSAFSNYLGVKAIQASALNIATLIGSIFYYQAFYPQKGMKDFAQTLVKNFKHYKGEIIYKAKVTKINIINNNSAIITYDSNNKKHKVIANIVVSNISPQLTFEKLISIKNIPNNYFKKIKKLKSSLTGCALYLGINRDISKEKNKLGLYLNKHTYIVGTPNIHSKTIAPKNKSIVRIIGFLPNKKTKLNIREKNKIKKIYLRKILQLFPDIKSKIEIMFFLAPDSYLKLTNNSSGAFFGAAAYPESSGKNSLPNKTPLKNLYLCGHWTNPMPAVQGVFISGLITAKEIISKH
jgi:prolycopene isomerase